MRGRMAGVIFLSFFPSQVAMLRPANHSGGEKGRSDGGAIRVCNTARSLWVNVICSSQLAASWYLLTNDTIKENVFGGFVLLCSVCKRAAQNIHTLSRTAEHRLHTQREQLQKGGRDMQEDGVAFGIGVKLNSAICRLQPPS